MARFRENDYRQMVTLINSVKNTLLKLVLAEIFLVALLLTIAHIGEILWGKFYDALFYTGLQLSTRV